MKKILINSIDKEIVNDSLFICSSSFEKRCLIIPNEISTETEKNAESLKELFIGRSSIIELSLENPLDNYDNLFDAITTSKIEHLYVDVSTFTRETLLIIIKILSSSIVEFTDIHLCYCPSSRYSSYEEGTSLPWQYVLLLAILAICHQ